MRWETSQPVLKQGSDLKPALPSVQADFSVIPQDGRGR